MAKEDRERGEPRAPLLEGPLALTLSLLGGGLSPSAHGQGLYGLHLYYALMHACFPSWFLPLARDVMCACPHTCPCAHALRAWFHAFQSLSPKPSTFPLSPNPFGKEYYLDDLGYY